MSLMGPPAPPGTYQETEAEKALTPAVVAAALKLLELAQPDESPKAPLMLPFAWVRAGSIGSAARTPIWKPPFTHPRLAAAPPSGVLPSNSLDIPCYSACLSGGLFRWKSSDGRRDCVERILTGHCPTSRRKLWRTRAF